MVGGEPLGMRMRLCCLAKSLSILGEGGWWDPEIITVANTTGDSFEQAVCETLPDTTKLTLSPGSS